MIFKKQIKVLCFIVILSTLNVFADKKEVGLLFVGETGTGKSTCINYIYNLVLGRNFEDPRDIIIPLLHGSKEYHVNVEEYQKNKIELQKKGRSQTKKVHLYSVENDEYKVNMWDTPGFQDTVNSQEREDEITKSIVDAFVKKNPDSGIHAPDSEIHAIVIVLKALESRLSQSVKEAMESIKTMLPKSFKGNIIVLYTYPESAGDIIDDIRNQCENADNDEECVINRHGEDETESLKVKKIYFLEAHPFFFDSFSLKGARLSLAYEIWESSRQTVNDLLSFASSLNKVDGEKIHELSSNVIQAEKDAEDIIVKIKSYISSYKEIETLGSKLEEQKKDRDDNKGYTTKETRTKEVRRDMPRGFGRGWLYPRYSKFKDKIKYEVDVVDETMKKYYESAEKAVVSTENEIKRLEKENEDNEKERNKMLEGFSKNRKGLNLGMNKDPYLVKIKELLKSSDIMGDDFSEEYCEKLKDEYLKKYYVENKDEHSKKDEESIKDEL